MNNCRKLSIVRRTSCSSLSRVLSTRSSSSTSPTSPTSLSQDYEKILCVQQQYEVRIWVSKHKETCYKPSHRTTNKHGETRYRLNWHEERYDRKRIHTHFLRDRNCEMQEGQNYLDSMQETHRWSHTSSSKIWGRIDNSRAQSLNWDFWLGKQSPKRYRGANFGSLKIRDGTKLLKADMESFPGIWH